MEERVRMMGWKMERKERKEMRRNIVLKGLKVEGKVRKGIEKVLEKIGVRVKIGEIKRIGKGKGEGGEMVVKLDSEEERKKVIERKRRLKGSNI